MAVVEENEEPVDVDQVDSLYPTAVNIPGSLVKFKGQEAEEVKKHYETAKAYVDLRQHQSVSELNLTDWRIKDFDIYFQNYYKEKVENGQIRAMPKSLEWPVSEYKDRV